MEHAIVWAVSGLVLVIVEVMTGTFYLLVLGIAAFGAALAAWLGWEFSTQAIVAAILAAIGCYGVHLYREKNRAQQMPPIDAGMPGSGARECAIAARAGRRVSTGWRRSNRGPPSTCWPPRAARFAWRRKDQSRGVRCSGSSQSP
jgi:hypothetical protein